MYLTLRNFKFRQDILAGHEDERTFQIYVVAIETVPVWLAIRRESAVLDTVEITHPAAQTAVEVFRVHTIQYINTWLPVLRSRYADQVLAQRVFRITHQDALITRLRFRSAKLPLGYRYPFRIAFRHFHPVPPNLRPRKNGTAHQIMRHERVLLLKGDAVIVALLGHGLDLTVGGGNNQLAPHATHLLDQQFHSDQRLPDGRLVYRKITQPRYFIYP